MKPITEDDLNRRLSRAAEAITPRKAREVLEQAVEPAKGDEWYLEGTRRKKPRTGRTVALISSLAACLAVCLLSAWMVYGRVDATVCLDVNPSVTFQVNCNEKVIRATANNADGAVILEGLDWRNTDVKVAVNAVIGSMVRHGYLTGQKDDVLLSVSSGSAGKTDELRTRLSGEIESCLTALVGSAGVFDQAVELDGELEDLAGQYGITPGKAALIQRVVEAHPELEYDTLARLSMTELSAFLTDSGVDLRDYVTFTGTPAADEEPEEGDPDDEDSPREDGEDNLPEDPSGETGADGEEPDEEPEPTGGEPDDEEPEDEEPEDEEPEEEEPEDEEPDD